MILTLWRIHVRKKPENLRTVVIFNQTLERMIARYRIFFIFVMTKYIGAYVICSDEEMFIYVDA